MKNTMDMNKLNTVELTMVAGGTEPFEYVDEKANETGSFASCDPPYKTGPFASCDPPY